MADFTVSCCPGRCSQHHNGGSDDVLTESIGSRPEDAVALPRTFHICSDGAIVATTSASSTSSKADLNIASSVEMPYGSARRWMAPEGYCPVSPSSLDTMTLADYAISAVASSGIPAGGLQPAKPKRCRAFQIHWATFGDSRHSVAARLLLGSSYDYEGVH